MTKSLGRIGIAIAGAGAAALAGDKWDAIVVLAISTATLVAVVWLVRRGTVVEFWKESPEGIHRQFVRVGRMAPDAPLGSIHGAIADHSRPSQEA